MFNEKTAIPILIGAVTTVAIFALAFRKVSLWAPNGWGLTGESE